MVFWAYIIYINLVSHELSWDKQHLKKNIGLIIVQESIQAVWQVWMWLSLVGKLWKHLLFDDFVSYLITVVFF